MSNNLDKLNRLRVNAGKPELKSWKASQTKLDEAINKLEAEGFKDTLPGANLEAKPDTPDPVLAETQKPAEEPEKGDRHDEAEELKDSAVPPSLAESALAKNVGKTEAKEEKQPTKGKASLARGLDSDTMAVQSRAKVRDHREAEKKANKKNKVKLSKDDRKQITDEAGLRKGEVDPKKDPAKAQRQKDKIKAKQDKRAEEGKTAKPKTKNADEITLADIAREVGKDPKVIRAKARRHEDKLTKLHSKGQDRWTFPIKHKAEIMKILGEAK